MDTLFLFLVLFPAVLAARSAGPGLSGVVRWRVPEGRVPRLALTGFGVCAAIAVLAHGLAAPSGDFRNHAETGRRLLAGGPLYSPWIGPIYPPAWGVANAPYPPAWGVANAPISLLPLPAGQLVLTGLALLALLGIVHWVQRLSGESTGSVGDFWAGALAIFLGSSFVMRDLADGGQNILLTCLVWGGISLWFRGRNAPAGALIGAAAAFKCTPALMLAYFAWKKEWRLVVWGAAATILVTLTPAIWLGPGRFATDFKTWAQNVARGLSDLAPFGGVLPRVDVVNVALRPALVSAAAAIGLRPGKGFTIVALGLVSLLVTAMAWMTRHRVEDRREAAREAAAVAILGLLVSPITWKAHCVAALPALVLLCARLVSPSGLPRPAHVLTMIFSLLVLPLRTDLLGKAAMGRLDAFGVKTVAIGLLLAAVLLITDKNSDFRRGADGLPSAVNRPRSRSREGCSGNVLR